ncbi:MAG: glycoside hydrolase family 95 protein [Planctomycetota bacterium]
MDPKTSRPPFCLLASLALGFLTARAEGIRRPAAGAPACERPSPGAEWHDRARLEGEAAPPEGKLVLWYRRPARTWDEALPVGNGRLGAMVFGGAADERIQLNEDTLWDGSALDPANPESLKALGEIRRLLFEGKNAQAVRLAERSMMGRPSRVKPYQSLGELVIECPGLPEVSGYRRVLDLDAAIASVRYERAGVAFEREAFASAPAGVIVLRFAADRPGALDLKLALKRARDAEARADPGDPRAIVLSGRIGMQDESRPERGLRFAARILALAEGGAVAADGAALRATEANAVTVLVAGATSYRGGDPEAEWAARLAAAAERPYEVLKAEHAADRPALFRRVSLDLGSAGPEAERIPTGARLARIREGKADPSLAALFFQYGRYLLIASSRPGDMPANLQGLWAWQMAPPWNADYHLNINLQMNYWPAETCNLAECHVPLFDLMDRLVEPGGRSKLRPGLRSPGSS